MVVMSLLSLLNLVLATAQSESGADGYTQY